MVCQHVQWALPQGMKSWTNPFMLFDMSFTSTNSAYQLKIIIMFNGNHWPIHACSDLVNVSVYFYLLALVFNAFRVDCCFGESLVWPKQRFFVATITVKETTEDVPVIRGENSYKGKLLHYAGISSDHEGVKGFIQHSSCDTGHGDLGPIPRSTLSIKTIVSQYASLRITIVLRLRLLFEMRPC